MYEPGGPADSVEPPATPYGEEEIYIDMFLYEPVEPAEITIQDDTLMDQGTEDDGGKIVQDNSRKKA